MILKIITPAKTLLNINVEHVVLPGETGEMDILRGHAKLIALLKDGDIRYFQGDKTNQISISGGCAEVVGDNVTVVTN